jgi:cobalt-zinc-cadmium efflux system protein
MTTHDHNPAKADTTPHDDETHTHSHGNPFLVPFLLILLFAFIEFFGGIWTKSLALIGDAWHMFSDVFALGLAMYAAYHVSKARRQDKQSRAEIIASIINAALMIIVVVWIVVEALDRLQHPQVVAGGYVTLIAFFGLIVNLVVAQRLHHQAHHHGGKDNLNHRAALLHVMGDILGSIAALVAGVVIYFTGWLAIDPLLSILISVLLLLVTGSLIRDIWANVKGHSASINHHHH